MPTTVTSSIGTSSRDYSDPQAWEDDCPADLVSDDKIWKGECYNDSEFTVSGGSILGMIGVTTDVDHYQWITVAAGESFQDTVRTNGLSSYDIANGVGFKQTGAYAVCIGAGTDYCRIERLQLKVTGGTSFLITRASGEPGHKQHVQDVVGESPARTNGTLLEAVQTSSGTLINVCIFITGATGGAFLVVGACIFLGCSAIRSSDQSANGTGYTWFYGGGSVMWSSTAFGFSTPASSSGSYADGGNNATDQASGLPGSNNQFNVTFNQTTPFTDAEAATVDLRAIAGTALIGNGVLSAVGFFDTVTNPNDISATVRADPPTIGHWEVVSAGGGSGRVFLIPGM